jgi:AcrR family transcriptional regulator
MSDVAEPTLSRRDLQKQTRRSTIVAEARQAFLRDGYAGMSMSGLIATLGGSKATLWSYFPSKVALFAAVLEDAAGAYARDVGEFLRLSDDLPSGLFELCNRLIGKIVSPEPLRLTRLVLAESGRSPEVGKIFYAHAVQPMEASVAAYLSRHMDEGRLRPTAPMAAARILIDLCNGSQVRCLWGAERLDADDIERAAAEITQIFLRAYGLEPTNARPQEYDGPVPVAPEDC